MTKYLFILLSAISCKAYSQVIDSEIKLKEGITVTASVKKFIPSHYSLDTCSVSPGMKTICLIDGKIWFGAEAGLTLPDFELKKLGININDNFIPLEVSGMFNPTFSGRLSDKQFLLERDHLGYILYGFFSDGAGSYTVHWKIVKNRSLRLKISQDEADFSWQTNK